MNNRIAKLVVGMGMITGGLAHAQAPGDQPLVVVAAPAAPAASNDVMARRWAVSLGVGAVTVAPDGDANTQFGTGTLAIRYRATPHLELELALAAGSANNSSTYNEPLELLSGTVGLRYRVRPGHKWDWYPLVDVGIAGIWEKDLPMDEQASGARARFDLGIGVERRFGNLGISAEARLVALGALGSTAASLISATDPEPYASAPALSADRETGGSLAIGATYYF